MARRSAVASQVEGAAGPCGLARGGLAAEGDRGRLGLLRDLGYIWLRDSGRLRGGRGLPPEVAEAAPRVK